MKFINKIKENKDIIIFVLIFIFTLIIFKGYISMHYATDTYNIMNIGYTKYAINNSFIDGRIFAGLFEIFADFINIPINILVVGFTIAALFISCIAVIILKNMIIDLKKTDNKFLETIAIIISHITIFNFMYVENLYFIESMVMSISILMYILAIREIIKKDKHYYFKSLLFAIIATFSYQGTISLFLVYGFVFAIAKHKENKKEIIKDLAIILLIALISFIVNFIQIKITTQILGIEQQRLGGIENILNYTKHVCTNFTGMIINDIIINCCGLFPRTLMVYFIIGILVIDMIYEMKYKDENIVIKIIGILVVAILVTTAMSIISLASYDTGRIHNQIGALVGLIYICMFCNSDIFIRNKLIKIIITSILLIYTIVTMTNTIVLLIQHKEVNKLEKEQCIGLEKYIEEYEQKNNTKVTEAKYFKYFNKTSGFFSSISNKSVLTYNGVACTWSSIGTINFYTNRNFENSKLNISENEEIFQEYLQLKNDGYDNNFVIINNILYYTVFI